MKFLISNGCNIWLSTYEFSRVSVNSAECHQVNTYFKFRIGAYNKWLSVWNNCLSHCGPLVHFVISGDVLWTVITQIAPTAI
jgi:hypothetical protein